MHHRPLRPGAAIERGARRNDGGRECVGNGFCCRRAMKSDADKLKLFTGRANPQLAQKICDYLQIPLGRGRTELFPDGEVMVRVEEDVRGRDCYIVQPTSHPVNAHYCELFIWIDVLRRARAKAVTAGVSLFWFAPPGGKKTGGGALSGQIFSKPVGGAR